MTKSILTLAILSISLYGCKKETDNSENGQDSVTVKETEVQSIHECYAFVQQKDTIELEIDQEGAKASGNLHFKNFEKDSNHGPVSGEFVGDTLKLDYTFQSEGTTSIREIRFLKSGNSMIMGIGDMDDKGGKMMFTKPSEIKYDENLVLVKTECKP